jgi:3-keto-5-aminohexanoate cleavage enzyme
VLKNKFVVNFTPTGMIPTKALTPFVPISVDDVVDDVLAAAKLGASMVHLHARAEITGEPTYKKENYGTLIKGIREKDNNLVIGVSTSGRKFNSFEKRSECLELEGDLKPDLASLTLSSVNFNSQASINSPDMIKRLAQKMLERNIKPELEAFDLGMINYAKYLIRKKLIKPPYYFNLILGNIACAQADMLHLGLMIKELPQDSYWSVGGIGDWQLKMNILSIMSGGGIRVGIEDNIWFDAERTKLATNTALVERILAIGSTMEYQPYPSEAVRDLLNLNHGGNKV